MPVHVPVHVQLVAAELARVHRDVREQARVELEHRVHLGEVLQIDPHGPAVVVAQRELLHAEQLRHEVQAKHVAQHVDHVALGHDAVPRLDERVVVLRRVLEPAIERDLGVPEVRVRDDEHAAHVRPA